MPGVGPAPTLTLGALLLTHTRFAVGSGATAKSAARRHAKPAPRGTTIRFSLSRAATVKLAVQQSLAGRRSSGHCVKPTRKLRRAKRCTRYATVFTFTRHGTSGRNAIAFSGRAGRRGRTPLAPGPYRLSVTATADRLTSKTRTARFTIVRR